MTGLLWSVRTKVREIPLSPCCRAVALRKAFSSGTPQSNPARSCARDSSLTPKWQHKLELKRRGHELYYYKTGNGFEVDFACCAGGRITQLIQAVHSLGDEGTRNCELRALIKALEKTGLERGEIITHEGEEELSVDGKIIRLIPAFKYLLGMEPISE